jgi:hypothetical protein
VTSALCLALDSGPSDWLERDALKRDDRHSYLSIGARRPDATQRRVIGSCSARSKGASRAGSATEGPPIPLTSLEAADCGFADFGKVRPWIFIRFFLGIVWRGSCPRQEFTA